MMKAVYNSLWFEGFHEARKEFEEAVEELRVSVPAQRIWRI